jgi:phosphoglycolate phosphatase
MIAMPRFDGIRAILFDFDGTLVEPSIDFDAMKDQVIEIAAVFGVDVAPWAAWPVLEIMERVGQELSSNGAHAANFASCANQAIIRVETKAAERVAPYPGVPAMLRTLYSRGYAVGIVTRNCRAAVEQILARAPLMHQVLLTRDDVQYVKPDPRHLADALDALGMRGEPTLMCGDHPMDIEAGRAIGAVTVGVLRPGVGAEYMADAQPDLVLEQVTDLPRHLGQSA